MRLDDIRRRVAGWLDPPREERSYAPPTVGSSSLGDWFGGPPTQAGPQVNERTALGITAVWRAINIYASTIAALSLEVRNADERGGSTPDRDHPVYDLIHARPNPTQPAYKFRQTIIGHALAGGNGYSSIEWNTRATRAVALHLLDPRNVEPRVLGNRKVVYHLHAENVDLPASDVIHIRGFSYDGVKGYSPISIAREQLAITLAQQKFEGSVYGNGAQAGGHIEMPGSMTPSQKADFRGGWNEVHQGSENAGKVGILTGGAKWVQTSFSPADAQMILARGFSVAEVARLYGIPLHMLADMNGATVGNAEQQALQFFRFSILPMLKDIEGELDCKLFSAQERNRGLFTRHDARSLLRGDTAAQMALNQGLFAIGATSINETRLDNGFNPLDDPAADYHWIPTNNLQAVETMGDNPTPTQPASNVPDEPPPAEPDPDPAPTA
jgi:HK97 family phage portal protein